MHTALRPTSSYPTKKTKVESTPYSTKISSTNEYPAVNITSRVHKVTGQPVIAKKIDRNIPSLVDLAILVVVNNLDGTYYNEISRK
jgi:hypothetical protein